MLNIDHRIRLIVSAFIPHALEPWFVLHSTERKVHTRSDQTKRNGKRNPRPVHEPQHDCDVAFVPCAAGTVTEERVFF